MKYRLLIDLDVYDLLAALPKRERRMLRKRFDELLEAPAHWTQFEERDAVGRSIGVTICGRFAVRFWDDLADHQIKILGIVPAGH